MGLETATSIAALNSNWPLGTDPRSQGDDHLRLIKNVLKEDVVSKKSGGVYDATIEFGAGLAAGADEAGAALGAAFLDLRAPSSAGLGVRAASLTRGGAVVFRLTNGGSIELTPAATNVPGVVVAGSSGQAADYFRASKGGATVFAVSDAGVAQSGSVNTGSNATSGAFLSPAGTVTVQRDTGQAAGSIVFGGHYGSTLNAIIRANGAIQTTPGSVTTISDEAAKTDIAPATSKLADLLRVEVVSYRLKSDPEQRKLLGFSAQQIGGVFPSLVEEVEDGLQAVNVFPLIPALVKALQELEARVSALEGAA